MDTLSTAIEPTQIRPPNELLDQLYAVRRSLSVVMAAIAAQPDDVRVSIATLVEAQREVFVERRG